MVELEDESADAVQRLHKEYEKICNKAGKIFQRPKFVKKDGSICNTQVEAFKQEHQSNDVHSYIKEFQKIKEQLNTTKSKLNEMPLQVWHKHTHFLDIASKINLNIRRNDGYIPILLNNAYIKFYEIISQCHNRPISNSRQWFNHLFKVREGDSLRSLHLCEAPGGFINAIADYIATHNLYKLPKITGEDSTERLTLECWEWKAVTLNMYSERAHAEVHDEMLINERPLDIGRDDRLYAYSQSKWITGSKDELGNLFHLDVLSGIDEHSPGKFQLVTADGSYSCIDKPGEQENMTLPLHMMEAFIAMEKLCDGGTFVWKRFTLLEASSIAMFYYVCNFFETVAIIKPSTSRPGNSETYIICSGFCPKPLCQAEIGAIICYFVDYVIGDMPIIKSQDSFPIEGVPINFLQQLLFIQQMFIQQQTERINYNIEMFDFFSAHSRTVHAQQLKALIEKTNKNFPDEWAKKIDWVRPNNAQKKKIFKALFDMPHLGNLTDESTEFLFRKLPWNGPAEVENRSYTKRLIDKENYVTLDYVLNEISLEASNLNISNLDTERSFKLKLCYPRFHHLLSEYGLDKAQSLVWGVRAIGTEVRELSSSLFVKRDTFILFAQTYVLFRKKMPVSKLLYLLDFQCAKSTKSEIGFKPLMSIDDLSTYQLIQLLIKLIEMQMPIFEMEFFKRGFLFLSRVSVAFLFLLNCIFEEVSIKLHIPNVKEQKVKILCARTRNDGDLAFMKSYIYGLLEYYEQMPTHRRRLTQLVPIPWLSEPTFYQSVLSYNRLALVMLMQRIVEDSKSNSI